ncbi:diguanylate cyclase [Paenibacillus rhizovicinus]|uniref:Diguanylate cyclase n=1 Tax=Paenibacillus rhizovicinus TaxID=2704463 RepID=A0A6C0P7D9_9BACL|nr:histidine kinase N-terminal 7TM domain-containing protein [Paenibacillus rhizovicinus]QHW34458.1 diguanylate cyclase [Paenibacillus rhizovicinus]
MGSSLTMYISLVATSGVFSLFLFLYAYTKRAEMPGARTFMLYMIAQSIYIFSVAFQMVSSSLDEIMRWTIIQYIGMAPSPALGLMVVLQYIGKPVTRKMGTALFVIPAVSIIMVATNGYHHLFYKAVTVRHGSSLPYTDIVIGQFYVLSGIFTFGSMLAGVIVLARRWRHTKQNYKRQLATLITGQFLPIVAAFVYLMGLIPNGMDPVPVVICITSSMYIWAIVSTQMLTIVPIAKEMIFESMDEGVVVLDNANRLIDFNGAASRMLPPLGDGMIGLSLDEAWIRMTGSAFPLGGMSGIVQGELRWSNPNGELSYYQVRASVVRGRIGEIVGNLLMLIDVTEARRLRDQLEQLAYHDGLTKLLNRTSFFQRGKRLLNDTRINGAAASVVLFDIDYFKRINDTYGHETGDFAIKHVAAVVSRQLPPEALFARYGGEEFVICLPAGRSEAGRLAEAARAALAAEPLRANGESIVITASFGVSQSAEFDGESLPMLLKNADMALYEAKRGGRNLVRLFEEAVTV